MGLDNSIEIKRNEHSNNIYDMIRRFEAPWDTKHEYDFEVVYFRKCWNIRQLIANCLDVFVECGNTPLNDYDILNIIDALKGITADNWDYNEGSVWTYEEQEENIQQSIEDLEYLYELMQHHDLDVYFYDSY